MEHELCLELVLAHTIGDALSIFAWNHFETLRVY
jgi:hypothetical protein